MATKVSLLTANGFEILAGSGITIAGAVNSTVITGDIGTSPTPTITGIGNAVLIGTNHAADAVTAQAKLDLTAAYLNAAGQVATATIPDQIGGTTITPGVYNTISGTIAITGNVILDAQGNPNAVFIFQAASTLTTASASRVVLINGAQACNVVWQVGSSATLGTYSNFSGDILALTSITSTTSATTTGRLLARNGAVTLDTDVASLAVCAGVVQGGLPPVIATVCNIATLASQGSSFNSLDKISYQALRLFFLAQAVYSVSAGSVDVRNIETLANGMKQYDYLPDYARRSAALEVLSLALSNAGVVLTAQQEIDAIAFAHCCGMSQQALVSAEICLWNLLFQNSL